LSSSNAAKSSSYAVEPIDSSFKPQIHKKFIHKKKRRKNTQKRRKKEELFVLGVVVPTYNSSTWKELLELLELLLLELLLDRSIISSSPA
jgi:hypothetical protein